MIGLTDSQNYTNIANAIRNKLNTTNTYTPSQMANAILQISSGESGSGSGFSGTPIAGDTPILHSDVNARITDTSDLVATGVSITIQKNGTYRFKAPTYNTYSANAVFGKTFKVQLYKNGVGIDEPLELDATTPTLLIKDIECVVGDVVEVYAVSARSASSVLVMGMTACIEWDNGF